MKKSFILSLLVIFVSMSLGIGYFYVKNNSESYISKRINAIFWLLQKNDKLEDRLATQTWNILTEENVPMLKKLLVYSGWELLKQRIKAQLNDAWILFEDKDCNGVEIKKLNNEYFKWENCIYSHKYDKYADKEYKNSIVFWEQIWVLWSGFLINSGFFVEFQKLLDSIWYIYIENPFYGTMYTIVAKFKADPSTFEIIDDFYAKDKYSVFCLWQKLPINLLDYKHLEDRHLADVKSFISLWYWFAKDINSMYYKRSTFSGDTDSFLILNKYYSKDKNNVYHLSSTRDDVEIVNGVDPASFQVLNDIYSKDKSNVYYLSSKIDGADATSFQVLNDTYAKDKNNVYYFSSKIDGADSASFEIYSKWDITARDKYNNYIEDMIEQEYNNQSYDEYYPDEWYDYYADDSESTQNITWIDLIFTDFLVNTDNSVKSYDTKIKIKATIKNIWNTSVTLDDQARMACSAVEWQGDFYYFNISAPLTKTLLKIDPNTEVSIEFTWNFEYPSIWKSQSADCYLYTNNPKIKEVDATNNRWFFNFKITE